MNQTLTSLQAALKNLPPNANQTNVSNLFAIPLLDRLGFNNTEIYADYPTGNGKEKVDIAARKNTGTSIFLNNPIDPFISIELKNRTIDLSDNSSGYQNTVQQLKRYLLAPNCKKAQWGLITNGNNIQLFRKHGKVIHPATKCFEISIDNIDDIAKIIRDKIEQPAQALTIAIYNNKGGVGKTTTTVNLAGVLTGFGKRVLAIDFDFNQYDLTKSLGLSVSQGNVQQALTDKHKSLQKTIISYVFTINKTNKKIVFDVVPADIKFTEQSPTDAFRGFNIDSLDKKLEQIKQHYDYILIDAPPNWNLLSKTAVYAADVVLIPTKPNGYFSLENAAIAIKDFIPEVREKKNNGSPVALPIFFNGENISQAQLHTAQQQIDTILNKCKNSELVPYFYPRWDKVTQNRYIHQLPEFAYIASSAFSNLPAVYKYKSALENYKDLAKEYFLQ